MLEFIEYPKCTTCKKAKKELDQLGLEYKDVHIVEETPSEKVILNWLETSGFELKQFFNTSGIKYRELGLKDKVGTLSNKEAAKLLASDGMLLKRPILVENHPILNQITSYLETYFKGQDQDLSELPLAPVGSDFEKRVWNYLRGIPFGQTVTYGQIAKDLQVASAQAVGGAVGRNPWSILVPCHRVLGAGGRLTGYAWGLEKKAWLLRHEGASYQENEK